MKSFFDFLTESSDDKIVKLRSGKYALLSDDGTLQGVFERRHDAELRRQELERIRHGLGIAEEQIQEAKYSQKTPFYVVDTSRNNKIIASASDESGAKRSIASAHLPPLSIKDKSVLKIVKSYKKQDIGYSLKESDEIEERCWDGYKPTPGKKPYEKGSCMKEDDDIQEEAEHDGKKVTLNKPFRTPDGPKKFAVYVKNDKGNVVKVTFGDPNMEIKRDSDERRSNFRARHNCDDPGPKWKARYWSCKMWSKKPVSKLT
jgi:hypothetical protein